MRDGVRFVGLLLINCNSTTFNQLHDVESDDMPMRVYIHINTGSYPNKTYSKVEPGGAKGYSDKSNASISLLSDDEDQMVFDGGPSDGSAILRQEKKTVSSPLFACRCRYQSCARS